MPSCSAAGAQGLLAHDLVDEIHLMASPVVLGHGRTLWARTPDKTAWTLTEATVYGDSTLVTIYERR
ncbi:dihydrofolate reductase family protein [Pseudonocardia sp.]|uniref:dihydrofolate reductase family protein n=1 Tax=Pseudonocardia sp. TaxID=60912 RepID=UPI002629EBAA|nr:dihydrofolate reductase family protein [Pseudonocardia sp.]